MSASDESNTRATGARSDMAFSASPLAELIESRRVIVVVGAGGVGKTTTAAALSVAAARAGKRVLCLTIDPAKRLAESLGLGEMRSEAVHVNPKRFADAGVPLAGSLTAMMLDTKCTFDELVMKYSSTKEKADKLLSNKLYQYVSTSLAGTQEYMAMEKLVAVKDDPRYDLVVLDTPPTANALDFLDAPERLVTALDSTTMKWFVDAFQKSGKFSLNILAKSAATILRGIGRITGGGFLEAMAEFIADLNDLFGGFKERARRVEQALRGPEIAFVLVTSASPPSIQEVLYFARRLEEAEMPRGAFVVNRFHATPRLGAESITAEDAEKSIRERALTLDDDAPARILEAHADAVRMAALDAHHLRVLEDASGETPIVRVLELETDVHDIRLLSRLADILTSAN